MLFLLVSSYSPFEFAPVPQRKVMAVYRQIYGFGHLWAECPGRDQRRNPTDNWYQKY